MKRVCDQNIPEEDGKKAPKIAHGGCGHKQPDSIRKEGLKLTGTYKAAKDDEEGRGDEKRQITPQDALNIFRNLSDSTLALLGLNADYARPEWMILTVLPVPPPTSPTQYLCRWYWPRYARRGRSDVQAW